MAKRLPAFEFKHSQEKHPWDKWLDGAPWELRRGEDFECEPVHFKSAVHCAARRRGLKVRTHIAGDMMVIRALLND